MKKNRPLESLFFLLVQLIVEQAVIRHTVNICTAAGCKWVATTVVERLFNNPSLALFIFSGALNVALILYGLHLVLATLEEHLKIPVGGWLEWLYHFLMPKSIADKPKQAPEKQKTPAQRKPATARKRKPRARRSPARAALNAADPAEVIPADIKQPAKPRRAPRRNKNQGLED